MPRALIAGCGFTGLATARLLHQAGWQVVGCTHSGMPRKREAVRNLVGANMSFRRDVLVELGGFDSGLGRQDFMRLVPDHLSSIGKPHRVKVSLG